MHQKQQQLQESLLDEEEGEESQENFSQKEQESANENDNEIEKEIEQIQKELDWTFKEGELDFNRKLFPQYDSRNNVKIPYTYSLIEDAMYADEKVIISLEYNIFNNDQTHVHLTDLAEVEQTDENISKLNCHNYQKQGAHPMSIFKNPPKSLIGTGGSFLDQPRLGKLMTSEEPELKKTFTIIGILAFWRVEIYGTVEKMCEKSFTHESEFAYTSQGNMVLQVTNDKKLLTLAYISNYGDKAKDGDGCILSHDSQVKIMAWEIDIKNYKFCKQLDNKFIAVNQNISLFLQQNQKEVLLVKSIKVTANYRHVVLTYNQQKLYDKQEPSNYQPFAQKRDKYKVTQKYAIFEVRSGKLVFCYGSFDQQLQILDEARTIYNIGMAVQDIKHQKLTNEYLEDYEEVIQIDEIINFYFTGLLVDWSQNNIMRQKLQEKENADLSSQQLEEVSEIQFKEFDWTLAIKSISLREIINSGDTPEKRLEWVKTQINLYCEQLLRQNTYQNQCFQFKSNCILLSQNWEASIILNVNSHFDQICVLNLTTTSTLLNRRLILLYKRDVSEENSSFVLNIKKADQMPLVIKELPKEGLILHGRNSTLKSDMYYTVQQRLQRGYAVCLRVPKYEEEHLGNLQIQVSHEHEAYNQFDVWCYSEKYMRGQPAINGYIDPEEEIPFIEHDNRPVMQICSIDLQNLQIEIITKIPRKSSLVRYDFIIKSSDTIYQQQGQWPIFAYNLGIEKICLIPISRQKKSKQYYFKISPGHRFLSFCEFNGYRDIGFFGEGILIEGCVRVAFITEYNNCIYLNLLLIDPFHPQIQFALFTSSYFISSDDYRAKDAIEAAFIIPSKSSAEITGKDKDFKIYLFAQYNSIIKRCIFKQTLDEIDDDSDFGIDQSDMFDDNLYNKEEEINTTFLERIFMQLDEKNFLYYVAFQDNTFKIMEINPKKCNFKHHLSIYQWKCNHCLAFSVEFNGKEFSFIDDTKISFTLDRQVNSRQLRLISESTINEMYQQDFTYQQYDPVIMCPLYIIQGNKIFYLERNDPFPNGYLMMETLTENFKADLPEEFKEEIRWFQGPIMFQGSNQFGSIDRVRKFYAYVNIMSLPDSTTKTLMVDNTFQINMSTFLSNGEILLRCAHRYLIFDKDGFFKTQVYFDDQNDLKGEQEVIDKQETKIKQIKKEIIIKKQKTPQDLLKEQQFDHGLVEDGDSSDEFEFQEKAQQHNKMKLIQFSADNKKFLFLNQLSRQLKIYKLITNVYKEGDERIEEYIFKKMYDLETKYSEVLKDSKEFLYNEQKYGLNDYLEKFLNINVEIDGSVVFILASQPDRLLYPEQNFSDFELVISIYQADYKNGIYKYDIHNIKKRFSLPSNQDIRNCHRFETEFINYQISSVTSVQKRLLPELKDKTDLQIINDDLDYLEWRKRRIINTAFQENILIVWQGSWLRWARIFQDEDKSYKLGELNKLDIVFEKYTEIIRVLIIKQDQKVDSGFNPDKIIKTTEVIQLFMKQHSSDQSNNRYIILSWDLNQNNQVQILEINDEKNERLEFNLVKGLSQKLNYFFDQNQICDIELGVPIAINRNQQEQIRHRSYHSIFLRLLRFHNQRKVFYDSSRYLQTKVPQALVFSYSYIQLRAWRDIFQQKNKIQIFKQVVQLQDFLIDFDGQNLFHVYVLNNDVLQYIHDDYLNKKLTNNLTDIEKILPQMICMSDSQNYTALFRAIERYNQKGFELLIELVADVPDRFVTKLLIRTLPKMLISDSNAVLTYFDNAFYRPLAFQEPIIMPWPDEFGDEVQFFTAKTTLLTQEVIQQKFFAKKAVQNEEVQQITVEVEEKPAGFETKETKLLRKVKNLKQERDFQFLLERSNADQKSQVREWILSEQLQDFSNSASLRGQDLGSQDESGGSNRRVLVEVIDFDFLFQNENCTALISTLSSLQSNKILTRQSIKCFVELMWSKYQPVIFQRIFLFYFLYLVMSVYLCSNQLPYLWDEAKKKEEIIAQGGVYQENVSLQILVVVNILISAGILGFFASLEGVQLIENGPLDYLSDMWNCIDVMQMVINSLIIVYTTNFLVFQTHLIPRGQLVRAAAFGNFLMWFKMFYWMRLFKATAKYVTLITETLTDLTYFMIMVAIIIQAFATFFYIINLNAMEEGLSYINDYGMPQYLTSTVQVYFYSLGEFSYDSFNTGPNVVGTWIMFLLATFTNSILFMNMLVAIMGDTFNKVQENSEANGLQQMVALIADYVSLVDTNKFWGDQRYIIQVQVVEQSQEAEENVRDLIQATQDALEKTIENSFSEVQNKISSIEGKIDG